MELSKRVPRVMDDVGSRMRGAGFLLGALALLACALPARAERLALVIGNDAYKKVEPLRNAVADARTMRDALHDAGFNVTLKENVTLDSMKEALRTFKGKIKGGDEVVIYFSGHGVQIEGRNFLIPVDAAGKDSEEVADDAVSLQRVLDDLDEQRPRFSLTIIDACRNNPFKLEGRGLTRAGLAPVTAATGQMVLYSAGAGQEALDALGPGDQSSNGVFTRVLATELRAANVPVQTLIKRVREQVAQLAATVHRQQVPALYDQSVGDFYFVGGENAAHQTATPSPPLRTQTQVEIEADFWDRIKDSPDPKDFADYLRSFPQGTHAATASLLQRKLQVPAGGSPGMPVRDTEVKVASVSADPYALTVTVANAPEGDVAISVNGVLFDARHQAEYRLPYMTAYRLQGAPKQLNLQVGENQISVRYAQLSLPEYRFRFSEGEMSQAESLAVRLSPDPHVVGVNLLADRLSVTVMHAPAGTPAFLINGRPAAGELLSQSGNSVAASYIYRGSAGALNLHSGENEITLRYPSFTTPSFSFAVTDHQLQESAQMLNRRAPAR
jgi:hypothetical protein